MTSREMFEHAIGGVLEHEGGDSDHPADRGGATRYGLSSRWHPDLNIATLSRARAIEVYWSRYWQGGNYDRLPLEVAAKVFDLAVNMGRAVAAKCLQRAARACGHPISDDGIIGDATIAAVSATDPPIILAAIRSEAAGQYRLIAAREPSQAVFLRGWLSRAYS